MESAVRIMEVWDFRVQSTWRYCSVVPCQSVPVFAFSCKVEIHFLISTKWNPVVDGVEGWRPASQKAALVAREAIQCTSMSGRSWF